MATNLVESVRSFITPSLVDRASAHLGESSDGVRKAIEAGIPAVLAGFIHRAERGDIHSLLRDAHEAGSHDLAETAGVMFIGNWDVQQTGSSLWANLFDGRLSAIPAAIASYAGIGNGSVNALLSLLAPLGLGVIGRHAMDHALDADGLRSFLVSQKPAVMDALPSGLNIGHFFRPTERVRTTTAVHKPRRERVERRATAVSMPLWMLLAVVALAFIWYLAYRDKGSDDVVATTTVGRPTVAAPPITTTTTTSEHAAKAPTKVRLPNGMELNAYAGGVEERLVNCLADVTCQAGKNQWFDFDNINFETGSARLTPESQVQINNIVAIMKAYPKAKFKIGGYTDRTGNEAANKKLSQERAETVNNALRAGGILIDQLALPEGYGSSFAKMPATATDEARRVDRRISVQLREK